MDIVRNYILLVFHNACKLSWNKDWKFAHTLLTGTGLVGESMTNKIDEMGFELKTCTMASP